MCSPGARRALLADPREPVLLPRSFPVAALAAPQVQDGGGPGCDDGRRARRIGRPRQEKDLPCAVASPGLPFRPTCVLVLPPPPLFRPVPRTRPRTLSPLPPGPAATEETRLGREREWARPHLRVNERTATTAQAVAQVQPGAVAAAALARPSLTKRRQRCRQNNPKTQQNFHRSLYKQQLIGAQTSLIGYARSKLSQADLAEKLRPFLQSKVSPRAFNPPHCRPHLAPWVPRTPAGACARPKARPCTPVLTPRGVAFGPQIQPGEEDLCEQFLGECQYLPGAYDQAEAFSALDAYIKELEQAKGRRTPQAALPAHPNPTLPRGHAVCPRSCGHCRCRAASGYCDSVRHEPPRRPGGGIE